MEVTFNTRQDVLPGPSEDRCALYRHVEIGRVAIISFGEEYGKLVVITDVVDQNRVSPSCSHPGCHGSIACKPESVAR